MRSRPRTARSRAVRRHILLTVLVAVTVVVLTAISEVLAVQREMDQRAQSMSEAIVGGVSGALADLDLSEGEQPVDTEAIGRILSSVDVADLVVRVKVWRVEGEQVRVVYSDEPRIVGETRPFDSDLAAELDAGESVVLDVPDDVEHRYEQEHRRDLREVYHGFTDRAGTPMRIELYIDVSDAVSLKRTLAVQMPLVLGGLLLLGAAMIPLSLRHANRLEYLATQRQEALRFGLASSERVRRDMAHRLHDGVIQDLAAAGLTLGSLASQETDPERAALLRRLAGLIGDDTDELRAIAHTSAPPATGSLTDQLVSAAGALPPGVELHVDEQATPVDETQRDLLWRVAVELVRNSLRHAHAHHVTVTLTAEDDRSPVLRIADDGSGFDPNGPMVGDRLGLRLVQWAVSDAGGTIAIDSDSNGTTVEVRLSAGD